MSTCCCNSSTRLAAYPARFSAETVVMNASVMRAITSSRRSLDSSRPNSFSEPACSPRQDLYSDQGYCRLGRADKKGVRNRFPLPRRSRRCFLRCRSRSRVDDGKFAGWASREKLIAVPRRDFVEASWPRAARASSVAEATSSRLASRSGLSFSASAMQSLRVSG